MCACVRVCLIVLALCRRCPPSATTRWEVALLNIFEFVTRWECALARYPAAEEGEEGEEERRWWRRRQQQQQQCAAESYLIIRSVCVSMRARNPTDILSSEACGRLWFGRTHEHIIADHTSEVI